MAVVYADPAYAAAELGWAPKLSPSSSPRLHPRPNPNLTQPLLHPRPHPDLALILVLPSPSPSSSPLTLIRWTAELGLEQMCKDSWNWISNNPDGFDTKA